MTTGKRKWKSPVTQWKSLKKRHPNSVVLLRVGDFYETFAADAQTLHVLAGVTLTRRNDDMLMAGFPHQALEDKFRCLIAKGCRVAISEWEGQDHD